MCCAMNERFWEKVNFGTYHHTDFEGSQQTRERVYELFSVALGVAHPLYGLGIDLGAGLGFLTALFMMKEDVDMVMVDSYADSSLSGGGPLQAISNLSSLGLEASLTRADLRRLPFAEESFDFAATNLTYHNIREGRDSALEEIRRVLKPGGLLFFGDLFCQPPQGFETIYRSMIAGKYLKGYEMHLMQRK